ncbi:aspartyl-phosphate phosphatase Spo0E family protein [Priestia abyssalis]|uniref:aspartyl-phosphate phosphatase Spo0E family protein n=1 Tax=Priestia abyssalis TaxID=1221450 RepID=UPI000994FE89|nr:aspartyl-phosphate phosphatase Spo0E family protein [Priestia abyssalis]
MILKNAQDLMRGITQDRKDMYELTKIKGLSDPEVIRISERLDRKIIMLQKMINSIRSSQTEMDRYYDYKHG